ncbi:MAG: MFS transporter [Planctomycetes bacterium]|nr:MFS transporter [Planctomycetota bacterium]
MLHVLFHKQFLKLWLSQVVSQLGDWLSRIAVLAVIGQIAGAEGAAKLGGLYSIELAIRLLPAAVFGPLAGPVADRLPRRLVMVAADVVRAAVVMGLLFVDGKEDLWLLYTLLVVQMSLSVFFNSAKSGALPSTVPPQLLHAANTLSAATWSVMLAVGTGLGAFLLSVFTPHEMFVLDALTYVVSALLLIGLRLPPVARHPQPFRMLDVLLAQDLIRGWRHARERGVAGALLAKTFWGPGGGFLVVISVLGATRFAGAQGDPARIGFATGMLYAARGVGTGLGPVLGRLLFGERPEVLRRSISLGFLVAAAGYCAVPFAPNLWLACLAVLVAHMGGSSIWVGSTTLWQLAVADEYRGRVFALEFLGMTLSFALSGFVAGAYYDHTLDVDGTIFGTAAAVVVMGTLWRLVERRTAADSEETLPETR